MIYFFEPINPGDDEETFERKQKRNAAKAINLLCCKQRAIDLENERKRRLELYNEWKKTKNRNNENKKGSCKENGR